MASLSPRLATKIHNGSESTIQTNNTHFCTVEANISQCISWATGARVGGEVLWRRARRVTGRPR
eukprot:scaffold1618_cov196-Alexandrium_tamarense.AAC.17